MDKIRLEYPSWHDDARRDQAEKHLSHNQLADKYGVARGQMTRIATPNWPAYLILRTQRDLSVKEAKGKLHAGNYEFVAVDRAAPIADMANRARRKPKHITIEEEQMAREREFKQVKDLHEGKMLVGAMISCSQCDRTESYYNFKGSVTPQHLPKEFDRLGWFVGKNARTDLCPTCRKKLHGSKRKKTEITIDLSPADSTTLMETSMPAQQLIPVLPEKVTDGLFPAEMTRADDRIITAKLEDVYIDESVGYKEDWTDDKVAKDLNVPLEWVAKIRDRSFGPEINATSNMDMAELQKLTETIDRQLVLAEKKIEQMKGLDKAISDLSAEIDGKIEDFNKAIDRFDQLSKSLELEDNKVVAIIGGFNGMVEDYKRMRNKDQPEVITRTRIRSF